MIGTTSNRNLLVEKKIGRKEETSAEENIFREDEVKNLLVEKRNSESNPKVDLTSKVWLPAPSRVRCHMGTVGINYLQLRRRGFEKKPDGS